MNKVFIRTMGCQMNEYDSKKMLDLLSESHHLKLTTDEKQADLLLLNTCSVREKAQEKLFHQLGRWRKLKQQNANILIAVGGCVASQEGEAILKRAPYTDIIFGPQTLHRLPQMINKVLLKKNPQIDISFPEIEKFDNLAKPKSDGVSAFVSIMEGCSKYCTFCIVPYTRGEEVSRPFNDVIKEIQQLASQGVREINLLGQNVNSYQGLMDDGSYVDLAFLIEIIDKMDDIYRIRYTTSHPVSFSNSLIEAYKNSPKLVSHLHLPIQSGSDKILTLMKRGHTVLEYKAKIHKLRQVRPNISLSSDFIIGFPNETDKDFNNTMELIDSIVFDKSFSFIYSKRPGTPASSFIDDVSIATKKQRLIKLQQAINGNVNNISSNMIGSTQSVLVENKSARGSTISGRTENNRVVHFKGDSKLITKLVNVKIIRANPNSLIGEMVS